MAIFAKLRNSLFLALCVMLLSPLAGPAGDLFGVQAAEAQTINRIDVTGNSRVDDATVISYLTVRVGDTASAAKLAASSNALLATGLFSTVNLGMSGNTLRVRVAENAIVGSVLFEGNQKFTDAQLSDMVDLNSRGTFTQARLQSDVQTIRLAYARAGYKNVTVTSRTENADNARIRVTFVINEGTRAGISSITFTGNSTFNSGLLKSIIRTKETHWLSWLFNDDTYDPDKVAVDSETIRLYYANHGFPDAQVLSAIGEYDATKNAYFVNFSISEGDRYKFGDIGIETSINGLNTQALKDQIQTYNGGTYSQAKLQASAEDVALAATEQGFAFADVRPRIDRDIANHTFNITYLVDEGARTYVERININGNTKTRDFVIRRELNFAEGDPFNRSLLTRGKRNIDALGFFKSVDVSVSQGSAPDKVIVNVAVVEKSTGDYGLTAGYDSAQGVLGEISLTETNFLGRGQYLKVALGATQAGRSFNFSFTEPRFMGLKISTGFDAYNTITNETAASFYGTDTKGGQVRFGVPLTKDVTASFFAGADYKQFSDTDATPSVLVTNGQTRTTGTLGYSLNFANTDDPKRPTSGLAATFTQTYAGIDNNYIRTEAKARYFIPLFEDARIVASIKGQAGIINDLSGSGVFPTETFRPGTGLVRGFQQAGIGPRAANGEALGSVYYAGLSAEVEFPVPGLPESYGLSAAIWGDIGFAGAPSAATPVATASGMTQQIRSSIGASLIWDSPFGPLRGDFAQVLQQDAGDKTQFFALTLATLF